MEGINTAVAGPLAESALRDLLNGRNLEVWVEVRHAGSGEMIYGFLGADHVHVGETVTVTHQIGAINVES
jgi:hypothetical protein